jgi:hypothetical protein
MTSLSKTVCALFLAGGLAAPAYAATTGTPSPDASTAGQSAMGNDPARMNGSVNDQPTDGQNTMRVGQKLHADLSKAGFTDISVVPSSFIVHAKNSQGNPVMMVISPDSVTAITERDGSSSAVSNPGQSGAAQRPNTTTGMASPCGTETSTKP